VRILTIFVGLKFGKIRENSFGYFHRNNSAVESMGLTVNLRQRKLDENDDTA